VWDLGALDLGTALALDGPMHRLAALLLLVSASAHAKGKGDARMPVAHAKAIELVRAEPFPKAVQTEILGAMAKIIAKDGRPRTQIIEVGSHAGSARIELQDRQFCEIDVSAHERSGLVRRGRDLLAWRFFPVRKGTKSEILRVDRGERSEYYRVANGRATRIRKDEGERLDQADIERSTRAEQRRSRRR